MNTKQAAQLAAKVSRTNGPQYVVYVADQGRDVFDEKQVSMWAQLIWIEAKYIAGKLVPHA